MGAAAKGGVGGLGGREMPSEPLLGVQPCRYHMEAGSRTQDAEWAHKTHLEPLQGGDVVEQAVVAGRTRGIARAQQLVGEPAEDAEAVLQ